MRIQAGFDIAYDLAQPTSMVLMLTVHPSRAGDLVSTHEIAFAPKVDARSYLDSFGNVCTRVFAPAGRFEMKTDFIIRDSGKPDKIVIDAAQTDIERLPDEALQFLIPSRYCDTEALSDLAWSLFSKTRPGWRRVQAICDYVHERISFGYQHARSDRTASQGHKERKGVCRDFAHLAVSLCRCMNIPTRYCTGYLGDIGVPKDPAPMDFSAWFEVFLDGEWYTFDARHNVPRIGRTVIARGRDAADVAISTSFGPAKLAKFQVVTDEVAGKSGLSGKVLRRVVQQRQAAVG
jgi:transglutaminase-like putative cysteine protease